MLDYSAPCAKDTGFFFLPVSFAAELVSQGCCSEMYALLYSWIDTVYNNVQVQGSDVGQVVYLRNGTGSHLLGYAELAQRWVYPKQRLAGILASCVISNILLSCLIQGRMEA